MLVAQAGTPAATGSPAALREQARAVFTQAAADFDAGRYREAVHGFEQVARWLPSAELWFNIGRAREELGELQAAVDAYRRYLRDTVDPPDRVAIEARIDRLIEARAAQAAASAQARPIALLRIDAAPEGAAITLDDATLGAAPADRWLLLEPGSHALRVAQSGYVPSVAQLELDAGTVTVAQARLVRQRAEATAPRPRVWTWVVLAVGSVALASGVGLAIADAAAGSDASASLEVARDVTLASGLCLGMLGALLYGLEGTSETRDVASR